MSKEGKERKERKRKEKVFFFFFNDTATTEIYTLSLHDALPILRTERIRNDEPVHRRRVTPPTNAIPLTCPVHGIVPIHTLGAVHPPHGPRATDRTEPDKS